MYTFPQLLTKNLLLGLLFSAFASCITLFLFSSYLDNKQTVHQHNISTIAQQVLTHNDSQTFAKILRNSNNYKQLNISTFSGESLYSYTDKSDAIVLPLMNQTPQELTLESLDLKITFQLSHNEAIILFIKCLAIVNIAFLLFIVLFCFYTVKKQNFFFKSIKQQIKNELDNINKPADELITTNNAISIPELSTGIISINELLKNQITNSSKLEKEAYVDTLTQLHNRSRFVQFYENNINEDSPIKHGVLLITRCSELQTINQIHGYHEGDNYISTVAKIITKSLSSYESAELFRLNSSDFACILTNVKLPEAEAFAQNLMIKFNEYQQSAELDSVAYTGMVYFDHSQPLGELLALADTAISVAQTQDTNAWYSQKDNNIIKANGTNYGNQNWRQEIENVIEGQRISLLVQLIKPSSRNSKAYTEILARFHNNNGDILPTVSFFAMAEKLDKIVAVDRLVVESAIEEILNKNLTEQNFGINLNARSINDEYFLIWLERKLLKESAIASRLIFEITESGLQQNIKTSKRFIDMVHRAGARITVERFGVALTSFKFFRDLKPDFIKMDSTYTRDIDEDKNNQYFLRLMIDLAHRLSINVLAESVESQEEKHTLEKLFIDGCQGFYIGKPKAI